MQKISNIAVALSRHCVAALTEINGKQRRRLKAS
jgi:hypothetical protein